MRLDRLLVACAAAAAAAELAPNDLVVVVHSGRVETGTSWQRLAWLRGAPRHVVIGGARGDKQDFVPGKSPLADARILLSVNYADNPGCPLPCGQPTYKMIGQYFGAQRTAAGLMVANDTYPDAKWYLVVDDDNKVDLATVRRFLGGIDERVPLFLVGHPSRGPGKRFPVTDPAVGRGRVFVCDSRTKPCRANVTASRAQAEWKFNEQTHTFEPHACPDASRFDGSDWKKYPFGGCCRTTPWPEGAKHGYPWRLDPNGSYRPHFLQAWPYGGAGYAISRGMFDAIGKDYWHKCIHAYQCNNADHRVMTCFLNAGYSMTYLGGKGRIGQSPNRGTTEGIPGILHHVRLGSDGIMHK